MAGRMPALSAVAVSASEPIKEQTPQCSVVIEGWENLRAGCRYKGLAGQACMSSRGRRAVPLGNAAHVFMAGNRGQASECGTCEDWGGQRGPRVHGGVAVTGPGCTGRRAGRGALPACAACLHATPKQAAPRANYGRHRPHDGAAFYALRPQQYIMLLRVHGAEERRVLGLGGIQVRVRLEKGAAASLYARWRSDTRGAYART